MDALTEQEIAVFQDIQTVGNTALVRSELDGEQVAVIVAVNEDDGDYVLEPLAVLVTDKIMDRLKDPSKD